MHYQLRAAGTESHNPGDRKRDLDIPAVAPPKNHPEKQAYPKNTMKAHKKICVTKFGDRQLSLRQMATAPDYWNRGAASKLLRWGWRGRGTIFLLPSASPTARVISIELVPVNVKVARESLAVARLNGCAGVIQGSGVKALSALFQDIQQDQRENSISSSSMRQSQWPGVLR